MIWRAHVCVCVSECECTCPTISIILVNKEVHFICETKKFLGYTSSYIRGIFSKLNTYHMHMLHNWCEFDCDLSITKGTLLTGQRTFSPVSRLLFEGFFRNFTIILAAHALQLEWVGSDLSTTKDTSRTKKFLVYISPSIRGFFFIFFIF